MRTVPGRVEGHVDDDLPGVRGGLQHAVGQLGRVADVGEQHFDVSAGPLPHNLMGLTQLAGRRDAQLLLDHPAQQLAPGPDVVDVAGRLDDACGVDAADDQSDGGVAGIVAEAHRTGAPGQLLKDAQHLAVLRASEGRIDGAVVQRGQAIDGEVLERRDLRDERGKQERLDQTVGGGESVGAG